MPFNVEEVPITEGLPLIVLPYPESGEDGDCPIPTFFCKCQRQVYVHMGITMFLRKPRDLGLRCACGQCYHIEWVPWKAVKAKG